MGDKICAVEGQLLSWFYAYGLTLNVFQMILLQGCVLDIS